MNLGPPHLVVSFRQSLEGSQGSVVRGTLCGKKKFLAPENQSTVGHEVYERDTECQAIVLIGQDWSSEVVAVYLEDWDGSLGLPHDHGPSLPRNEGPVLGGFSRRRLGGSGALKVNCQSKRKPFPHRGRAVIERRGMWSEKKKEKKECERHAEVSKEDLRVSSF